MNDVKLHQLLLALHERNQLRFNDWSNNKVSLSSFISDKKKARNTLELARYVATDEEVAAMKNSSSDRGLVLNTSHAIEERSMDVLLQWEGVDVELEKQLKKHTKGGSTKQLTYGAIGDRVRSHKQALQKSMGVTRDFNNEKLRPMPTDRIDCQGTPEKNASLKNYFQPRDNRKRKADKNEEKDFTEKDENSEEPWPYQV